MAADTTRPATAPTDEAADTLHLTRWTVTSGSNANSRGAVVIAGGDHQWEASAEGNGAVDALFRAGDKDRGEPKASRVERARREGPACGAGRGSRPDRHDGLVQPLTNGVAELRLGQW